MKVNISVIIPCFNEEKKIGKCLNSLLNQEVKPYEIIVVDGGSTDRTKDVVKKYQKKSKLIRLLNETGKRSPANARNMGWKAAKGNYILFVDADSVSGEDFIKIIKNCIMNKKTSKDLVFYPSIVESWKEMFMKYFWYGRTMPRYLLKNKSDFKTILRALLSLGLIILPFFYWNTLGLYLFLLNFLLILVIGAKSGIASYKKSGIVSFLVAIPINIFFIFISTGLGLIAIPFLYLTGKYNIGR